MTIRQGIVSTAVNLGVFATICIVATNFHWWKRLSARTKKREPKNDADELPKLVVISGCDRGFGRLLAEALVESTSHRVLALTLTEEASADLLKTLPTTSTGKLFAIKCDVTSEKDTHAMKIYVEHILDEEKAVLYGIVNNAGIADPGDFAFFAGMDTHRKVMEVNYFGQLRVTQALLPLMLRTSRVLSRGRGPRIINLSSVCGVSASPGNGAYSASKFAVEAWSDSLRLELLPFNLHVIKVRPGQIRTQIQSEWFDSYTKNYEAAPGQIRQLYGADKFSDKVADAATKMSDTEMSHPSLVVRSLQDILALQEEAKIEPYYWIGSDAHTFWRALHILPTPVADTIKSAMVHFLPERQDLPPTGVISHVTIRVRSIQASVPFYEAFGFVTFGPNENCQQFLQSGASKKYWSPMVLLLEDPRMEARGKSSDAGMTRLSLLTTDLKRDMLKLASKGIQPMGPMSEIGIIRLAAFHDPDNFVVYIVEFKGIVGAYIGATLWWGGKMAPSMFSWTVNCISVKHCMSLFEKLGFKTFSDQNTDQVAYSLLPAFNIDPKTTLIEHVRMCKLPDASVFATLMEWTTPKSERTGGELMNTMTITVSDVHAALDKARMVGMSVPEDGAITYRRVPVYGEVLVGTAYLEDACNRIDFCSFANRRA